MNIEELYSGLLEGVASGKATPHDVLVFQIIVAKRALELQEWQQEHQAKQHAWAKAALERQTAALERIAKALEMWGSE